MVSCMAAWTEGLHTKNCLLDPSLTMEFTRKDASAFARLRRRKRAQIRETRCLLEKRSQHLMEQTALLKHDIDTFESELAAIGIHDYLTGVVHVCACTPLCPAVWSMLPVELLQRVFARLPLPDIIRLRVLSKTWDKYVTGVTPGFTKLCAERNPNMFALISEGSEYDGDFGPMVIKLYNSKQKGWHKFVHETCVLLVCETMFAGNGGLVCLVCTARDKETYPLTIVVFNPLTRQWRKLPSSSSLSRIQPQMVQLVMDRDSKCYKVLVVGPKEDRGGDAVARIFSSETGKWSKPNIFSDLIFGYYYSWKNGPGAGMVTGEKVGPRAFDCANSTFLRFSDGSYPCRFRDRSVLVKDHLFVLAHVNYHDKYVLQEYQAQSCQPHWVPLKVYECTELDEVCGGQGSVQLETQLWGCQDFLVVIAYDGCEDETPPTRTLLFDLSTRRWRIISEIPAWSPTDPACDMFELRWDAVP